MASLLLQTLRERTAQVHHRLEAELDLLRPPLRHERMRLFLERLHGFHAVWDAGTGPRLERLRSDLLALGGDDAEIDLLPRCEAARGLTSTPQAALGALYVVDGSALGGVVIGRALAEAGFPPLRYFDVDGRETAAAWRRLQDRLARTPETEHGAVAEGAEAAFRVMRDWLAPARADLFIAVAAE